MNIHHRTDSPIRGMSCDSEGIQAIAMQDHLVVVHGASPRNMGHLFQILQILDKLPLLEITCKPLIVLDVSTIYCIFMPILSLSLWSLSLSLSLSLFLPLLSSCISDRWMLEFVCPWHLELGTYLNLHFIVSVNYDVVCIIPSCRCASFRRRC